MTTEDTPIKPWYAVRRSKLHGNGVFAARKIPAGTRIIEYGGKRISAKEADRRHPTNPDDPFHTFFFALSCGKVIDGGNRGTDARWINHSCAPNCETQENSAGTRVYIMALRDITAGEELFYDYGLVMEGKITKKLQKQYQCLCGSDDCRHTMLALPEKKSKKKKAKEAADSRSESKRKAKPKKDKGGKKDKSAKSDKKKEKAADGA